MWLHNLLIAENFFSGIYEVIKTVLSVAVTAAVDLFGWKRMKHMFSLYLYITYLPL